DCHILEARARAGGRCWTVRAGTTETELDGEEQVAAFDQGLYFNPGPARIPHHHQTTLNYCKAFGLAVEVFTNVNEAAYYYHEEAGPLSGQKVRIREAKTDMRGYVSELLAKALRQDQLDLPLTPNDRERMVAYLRADGGLAPDLSYQGAEWRGYMTPPGAGLQAGMPGKPHDLSTLLDAGFGYNFNLEYAFDQQMTMFQIAGGTDQLAQAFERQVGQQIQYEAEVREIRKKPEGVAIVYADKSGQLQQLEGDFCICTIPLSVLRDIPADFSSKMQAAIRAINYIPTGKMGLQFSRRFWEEDEQIFGGITRTNMNITQIWYPSWGYLSQKGILLGYYHFGDQAIEMGQLSPAGREARALEEGRKIHPQYDETFEASFSVAWHKIKYTLGGWAFYFSDTREQYYPTLNEPDGAIYLAGEHVSYLNGWMAGALESAQQVVTAIHERVLSK
ncbi:MAG TPA: flavin monoamine oxidase family protein, partial [Anaerolineae bacterium]|nr:flavin monoamine oxidase family protein [Anaerolineae bacterium]